ncbi:MAG: hypothetical protein GXY24_08610 [Bacteroidales bacterium]|nr:hypothetical protein [Bacteroidales bacterium]
MIANRVSITGLDDVLRTFEQAPAGMQKVVKKCMTSAARKTVRVMKSRTPKRWRGLVGYKVWSSRKIRQIGARMGYYASKGSRRSKNNEPDINRAFDWYKAYWSNYGTLAGRDPQHKFRKPVKPSHYAASGRRKSQAGIRHKNFFEQAISGWENTYVQEFRSQMEKQQLEAFNG